MWTLLKQSPEAGKPTVQKAVIACPATLVGNWANELGMFVQCRLYVWYSNNFSEMAGQGRYKPLRDRWESFEDGTNIPTKAMGNCFWPFRCQARIDCFV